MDVDIKIRMAAFGWLTQQTEYHGDVLPRELLRQGFQFQDSRIPLISPQGIFKPRLMELPLSITTSPNSPYDDHFDENNLLQYRYRGTNPYHRDNIGLRMVFERQRPLAYFHGIVPGRYLAVWPVYIIGDDPANLTFTLAVDEPGRIDLSQFENTSVREDPTARRRYITAIVRQRLHQRGFRERVLEAYRTQCAFCRLRHRELLDAAHIIPDIEEAGVPEVRNGISLCKLHHASYDRFLIGVTPDYVLKVREDIQREKDGPILLHGLQALHDQQILLPRSQANWPDRDALDQRYKRFLETATRG
ncbi:MAG: HNH endonuclease [Chloroflexota bacterium]